MLTSADVDLTSANADPGALLGAPTLPPPEWFSEIPPWLWAQESHDAHVVMTGAEVGRFAAIYYDHDVCYLNAPGACWRPPASPSGNECFHVGHIDYPLVGGGSSRLLVGALPLFGGHTDPLAHPTVASAVAYRARTPLAVVGASFDVRSDLPELVRVIGCAYDLMLPRDPNNEAAGTRQAGVVLGAVMPSATIDDAIRINAVGMSGEWWPRQQFVGVDGQLIASALDALGPVFVPKPAIPSNRGGAASAAGAAAGLPMAASVGGMDLLHGVPVSTLATPHAAPVTAAGDGGQLRPVIPQPVGAHADPVTACSGCGGTCGGAAPTTASETPAACHCQTAQPDQPVVDPAATPEVAELEAQVAELKAQVAELKAEARPDRAWPVVAALDQVGFLQRKQLVQAAAKEDHTGQSLAGWLAAQKGGVVEYATVDDLTDTQAVIAVEWAIGETWGYAYFLVDYTLNADMSISFGATATQQASTRQWVDVGEAMEIPAAVTASAMVTPPTL